MKTRIVYISDFFDKEFDRKEDCVAYDNQWKKAFSSVKFYIGKKRMKLTTATADDCYNTATRVIFSDVDTINLFHDYYGWEVYHKSSDAMPLKWKIDNDALMWIPA